jgi:hypothetical protein
MKGKMLDELPKHTCTKPGNPWIAFAPLDIDVMKALVERGASREDVNAQVKAWIATDAAKNPNPPTGSTDKTFHAALLSNIPFAVYCRLCLQPICLIHPEQMKKALP